MVVWTLQAKTETQAAACQIYALTLHVSADLSMTEAEAHLLARSKLPPHAVRSTNPNASCSSESFTDTQKAITICNAENAERLTGLVSTGSQGHALHGTALMVHLASIAGTVAYMLFPSMYMMYNLSWLLRADCPAGGGVSRG